MDLAVHAVEQQSPVVFGEGSAGRNEDRQATRIDEAAGGEVEQDMTRACRRDVQRRPELIGNDKVELALDLDLDETRPDALLGEPEGRDAILRLRWQIKLRH